MDEQKEELKTQQANKVLQALQPGLEKADIADYEAHIGPGEIESAYRYLVQKHLKLRGA